MKSKQGGDSESYSKYSMEPPSRADCSVPSPQLPYTTDQSYGHHQPLPGSVSYSSFTSSIPAACGAFSDSSSSQEVVTPHVDVVVCTCADRIQHPEVQYDQESSLHDAGEATPLSGSVVNMEDSTSIPPPPSLPPPGLMMAPATPPPAYSHCSNSHPRSASTIASVIQYSTLPCSPVTAGDIPIQTSINNAATATNAYDPLIHSSYSLASSSVTVNQLQRVATGAGLCVSADLLTTSTIGPVCRICHLPSEENKQLISPCRCSGTLQFIHNACLVKWLEISMKKYRQRIPRCELCNFEYIRRKRFRFRGWQCPSVSRRDRVLHFIFLISLVIMLACAVITIQLFLAEKDQGKQLPSSNRNAADDRSGPTASVGGSDVHSRTKFRQPSQPSQPNSNNNVAHESTIRRGSSSGNRMGGGIPGTTMSGTQGRMSLSWEEAVTLGCGVTFFVAFFVAMTAQIKARRTVYQLLTKCFHSNLIWEIQEYVPEHDKSLQKRRAAASAIAAASAAARAARSAPSSSRQHYQHVDRSASTVDINKRYQPQPPPHPPPAQAPPMLHHHHFVGYLGSPTDIL